MPLAAVMRLVGAGLALALLLAMAADAWSQSVAARMPRQVRAGAIDMVIQRVEPEVRREEVLAAVQAQLDRETMCFPWPSVWLAAEERRRVFIVRFDLMERDWGADFAAQARARMQDFVDMGLLAARERADIGAGVIEFRLTGDGHRALRGSTASGRLSFCLPSERRVVEITSMEFGAYACGTLQVRFTHVADGWPSWARTSAAQVRVAETWAAPGALAEGGVSMSRQWFAGAPPDGRENGQLRSLCYDERAREVRGEDMEISAAPPQ